MYHPKVPLRGLLRDNRLAVRGGGGYAPTVLYVHVMKPGCERGAVHLSLERTQIRAQGLEDLLYLLGVKAPAMFL